MKTTLKSLAVAGTLGVTALTGPAVAEYPDKPVTIVVPYAAGGLTDLMARAVAEGLTKEMGQPFVVENKPGAGGAVGLKGVINSDKDGYTLVMIPANIATMKQLYPSIGFDPVEDIAPVANIGASAIGMAVNKTELPVGTVAELVDHVKANPDLSYTDCGNASPQQIVGAFFREEAQIEMTHINYKGCGASIPDVLAGRVPLVFASLPHLLPHMGDDGKLSVLAITSAARSPLAPELPTLAESGYPQIVVDAWFGVAAPKGTPDDIIDSINAAINTVLGSDTMKELMATRNVQPIGGSAEDFARTIAHDSELLSKIVQDVGIRAN
ncbi:Bug family tripartite tricarboxylate transporter substrate binding protein [Nitratireductor indicus]|uniref:Bug family tripartite tricarboxylate transporter substrate binding protein n=1 Tax=Nitratireductor indicus TaxID=721133 RepID=UPI0028756FFB|nr:tripartite tricarboxylate transporter substrate-binding protein [Nitratireductor indicus]MDS1138770.1 tripartite tricarboxylate transporter substrate-binding protein [Nitratireductor indicus]